MKALLLALVATLATGCVAGAGYGYSTGLRGGSHASVPPPPPPRSARARVAGPSYAPGEDQHWFSSDDYLVAPVSRRAEKVQRMRVAKMIAPPAESSQGEAHFLVANGRDLWTRNYFQSRVATPADLAVGAPAFCQSNSTWRKETSGPLSKQDARNDEWILGAITDTSDSYKGRIAIASYSCPIDAVRVPIR